MVEAHCELTQLVGGADLRGDVELTPFHTSHRQLQPTQRLDERPRDKERHGDAEQEARAGDDQLHGRGRDSEELLAGVRLLTRLVRSRRLPPREVGEDADGEDADHEEGRDQSHGDPTSAREAGVPRIGRLRRTAFTVHGHKRYTSRSRMLDAVQSRIALRGRLSASPCSPPGRTTSRTASSAGPR